MKLSRSKLRKIILNEIKSLNEGLGFEKPAKAHVKTHGGDHHVYLLLDPNHAYHIATFYSDKKASSLKNEIDSNIQSQGSSYVMSLSNDSRYVRSQDELDQLRPFFPTAHSDAYGPGSQPGNPNIMR